MNQLQITLSEDLWEYVEQQVASGEWGNPAEYLRELVRQDRQRRLARLQEQLAQGIASTKLKISEEEMRTRPLVPLLRERSRKP